MATGRVFRPTSPAPYSPLPSRRSLSPSPALYAATIPGFVPTSPLRGRAFSSGTYPHSHQGNHHMQSVSATSLTGPGGGVNSMGQGPNVSPTSATSLTSPGRGQQYGSRTKFKSLAKSMHADPIFQEKRAMMDIKVGG